MPCHNNVLELEAESQVENMHKYFGGKEFVLSEKQLEYADYIFGLNRVKSKEEMRKILLPLLKN